MRNGRLPPKGRVAPPVVIRVHFERSALLAKVIFANDVVALRLRFRQSWEDKCRQEANDRDDDKKLDQREPIGIASFLMPAPMERPAQSKPPARTFAPAGTGKSR